MIPNLSLSAAANSSAKGGEFGATNNIIRKGDFNFASGSSEIGVGKNAMLYLGIAAVAYLVWRNRK
jgi:hypothetical protein